MEVLLKKNQLIVVLGATGLQGSAITKHLLNSNWKVKAVTRNPDQTSAEELRLMGAEIVKADMDDIESLNKAIVGAYGVYSVQNFWEAGYLGEIQQGKNVVDAAHKANIKHLVYASVGGAERNVGAAPWESKWEIEKYVRDSTVPYTIIRPAGYMENYYIPEIEKPIVGGKLIDGIKGNKSIQFIATDNIGEFGTLVFNRPEEFLSQEIEIASEELTNIEVAQVLSKVMGRPVKYKHLPPFLIRIVLGKLFYKLNTWFNDSGFQADIKGLRQKYPEIKWKTLEDWLVEEKWNEKPRQFKAHAKTHDMLHFRKNNPKSYYKIS